MFGKYKINLNEVYKLGIAAGIAELAYVLVVVLVMNYLSAFMNKNNGGILGVLCFLLLFVFSAAVSGLLVLGYPAYLALQNKYQSAILTVLITLLTLFTGFLAVLLVIIII
jgi:hypothetical protein